MWEWFLQLLDKLCLGSLWLFAIIVALALVICVFDIVKYIELDSHGLNTFENGVAPKR